MSGSIYSIGWLMPVTTLVVGTIGTELIGAQQSAVRNRAWLSAFMRKLRCWALEASVMLLIASLVAGTFMLAGSFSLIAVLTD